MQPKNIPTAPEAIGPYCHAMQVADLVFCSGQTPLDPKTMKIIGTDIRTQTERVLQNLTLVLAGVGLDLKHVAKTTVYLKDMADFQGMNEVYSKVFGDHRPSRTTVAVKQNPLDALVEIECIAAMDTIPVADS